MKPGEIVPDVGDASGLAEWVERYGDQLVQFAYTFIHDWEAAQDLAQETFVRATRARRRLTPAWLFTVAHHLAIDEVRRRRRVVTMANVEAGASEPDPALPLLVTDALRRLSHRDRECLWLFYYAGLSLKEVGTVMGLSVSQVKGHLYRARRHFAAAWTTDQDGGI
ncbi:MAG: RNA polymerase sigma factor [Clostridia bacterium]